MFIYILLIQDNEDVYNDDNLIPMTYVSLYSSFSDGSLNV